MVNWYKSVSRALTRGLVGLGTGVEVLYMGCAGGVGVTRAELAMPLAALRELVTPSAMLAVFYSKIAGRDALGV